MKVNCPACQAAFNIPDEKITFNQVISGRCPSCRKGVITIDPSRIDPAIPPRQPAPESSQPAAGVRPPNPPEAPKAATGGKAVVPEKSVLKKQILLSVEHLPAIPDVVIKARRIMENPEGGIRALANTLEKDTSLVSRILRLANSAYYGLSGKVTSIQVASVLLGEKILSEIIETAGISGLMRKPLPGYDLKPGSFWQHNLAVGVGARLIARKRNPQYEPDAFMMGILHDVGKLLLEPYVFKYREHFHSLLVDANQSWLQAEKLVLGFDHAEFAEYVCRRWHFSETIFRPIRYHHYPSRSSDNFMAYTLHVADYIATISGLGIGSDDLLYHLEDGALTFLALRQQDISDLLYQVVEAVDYLTRDSN